MKVFIVFCAFLLLFSMFFVYTTDMNKYIQLQVKLKSLAEDSAEAGALTIDEEALLISDSVAKIEAQRIVDGSFDFKDGKVSITRTEVTNNGLGYRVYLLYEGEDIFRLPFLEKKEITRWSEYVWE